MYKVSVFYGENKVMTGYSYTMEDFCVNLFTGEDYYPVPLAWVKFIVEYKDGEIVNMYNPNDI